MLHLEIYLLIAAIVKMSFIGEMIRFANLVE